MTPKREEYLHSISYEEKIIRDLIDRCKEGISSDKQPICFNVDTLKHKKSITKLKIIIRALKKQLPAPMKEEIFYNVKVFSCPVCDVPLDVCVENYCFKCGQKLK